MPRTVMKTTQRDGASLKTPFLERNMAPETLDLVWDNWRSQVEAPRSTPNTESFASTSIPTVAPSENNSHKALVSSANKSSSGRRWGIFGPKKSVADTPTLSFQNESRQNVTRKKSKLLKKQSSKTKSTPNLKGATLGQVDLDKVNAYYASAPVQELPPQESPSVPQSARIDTIFFHAREAIVPESDDAAVYFTVDPGWDESRGEAADVYLLPFPFPSTFVCDSPDGLEPPALVPRPRAITQVVRAPRPRKKTIAHVDDETSFLILE